MTYMTIPSTISGGPRSSRSGWAPATSSRPATRRTCSWPSTSTATTATSVRCGPAACSSTTPTTSSPNPEDRRFTAVGIPITGAHGRGGGRLLQGQGQEPLRPRPDRADLRPGRRQADGAHHRALRRPVRGHRAQRHARLRRGLRLRRPTTCATAFSASSRPQVSAAGTAAGDAGRQHRPHLRADRGGRAHGAGYPITPWSTVMETLRTELSKYGGIFVQAEDELAAIAYALGFAYSGHLAVTGSSGPGLSLKMEALGWAVDGRDAAHRHQRAARRAEHGHADQRRAERPDAGDLRQPRRRPRVVLAPKNVEDCFYIALEAGADRPRVQHPGDHPHGPGAGDPDRGVRRAGPGALMVDPKPDLAERGADFKPYPLDSITRHAPPGRDRDGKVPDRQRPRARRAGPPDGNPALHHEDDGQAPREAQGARATLPVPEVYGDPEGDVLLVGWGSTWGPIREAVGQLRAAAAQVGQLHLRHLHPLPPASRSSAATARCSSSR
jgi:2-oxoglutarate/2-oxoacid ferredoxin oxidoreductase subunit alpha